jgi:hypothetical protein
MTGSTAQPDWLDVLGPDHESNVQMIATLILLREGGSLAEELLAPPANDAWETRRAYLRGTVAWQAAECMLAQRRFIL